MRFKRSLSLILALMLTAASVASCNKTENGGETTENGGNTANVGTSENGETAEGTTAVSDPGSFDVTKYLPETPFTEVNDAYTEASSAIYEEALGEFSQYYTTAKAETNVSKKWALMALAEAKLLSSGIMFPTSCDGGNYAIGRVAPYTIDFAQWGNDDSRYHQALVTEEIITTEHRTEMKAKWGELRGTGTYEQWAKDYLADKGYTIKDTYTLQYSGDPQTWDVLATSRAADSDAIVNTYDGLLEYDTEGTLKPALATGLGEFSEPDPDTGYVTVTYKIREGVKWVDSQGREVGTVTADDFVAGMQHMCDAQGGLEWLLQGVVVNVNEYILGEVTDFSEVGVKAIDDYTLQYTLTGTFTYFETMLGYGCFAPMNRAYYTSQGGQFGLDAYDPSAETYKYGKDPDSIAYCGPYIVTNYTADNTIVFSANESYWNKDNINIHTLT
ncbi:MAG: ABC transporter substrate-binding protein, partial [Eubacteriales bacterium]